MKNNELQFFNEIFFHFRPSNLCEIGTNNGVSAFQFCNIILNDLKYNCTYTGFDLFDLATEETHKHEINGKKTGSLYQAVE